MYNPLSPHAEEFIDHAEVLETLEEAARESGNRSRVAEILGRVRGVTEIVPSHDFRASEDFTAMMRRVQSRGGQATELIFGADIASPHHSERFDFDEAVLPLALDVLTALAMELGK